MALEHQNIRIRLKAFDHRVLDVSTVEIVNTAAYIKAFNEEADLRSRQRSDFNFRIHKLESDRLIWEDTLRRDKGMSVEEAHARGEKWYSQMYDALKKVN